MFKPTVTSNSARVYSKDFCVEGDIHFPLYGDTLSILNNNRPFLPMTGCRIHNWDETNLDCTGEPRYTLSFLALPKERILWVEGGIASKQNHSSGLHQRTLYLLFHAFIIKGNVTIDKNARLSDYLANIPEQKPFREFQMADFKIPEQGKHVTQSRSVKSAASVVVNMKHLGGIFDVSEDHRKPDLSGY